MVLMAFCESAKQSYDTAKRKAAKDAEKHAAALPESGGVLAVVNGDTAFAEHRKEATTSNDLYLDSAFRKIWHANRIWCNQILSDAKLHAQTTAPRPRKVLDRALGIPDSATIQANEFLLRNLWPALQSRGWKEDMDNSGLGERKIYRFKGKQVRELRKL